MASLRESSPIRGDLDIREQLADFKQWLVEKLPLNRQAKLTFVIDIIEEQWWDVDQIKRLSNQDAFDWKIPTGLLQLIKKEVSGFKKAFKSKTDVHQEAQNRLDMVPEERAEGEAESRSIVE